mgnify:CR=1 FL=1
MKTERRVLEDWEAEECARLKAELQDYNKRLPKGKRLTQEEIADHLGMSQGTLSSHLNGKRPINLAMASKMAKMLDIEVSAFSPRLAEEILEISRTPFTTRIEVGGKVISGVAARDGRIKTTGPMAELIQSVTEKAIERAHGLAMKERYIGPNRAKVMINAEVQESIASLVAEIITAADSGEITDEQINAIRALIGPKKIGVIGQKPRDTDE